MSLQPGIFNGIVVSHKWGTSGTGSPYLAVTVEIDDGFGNAEPIVGKIYFTPKSMGMARGQLRALGFDSDAQAAEDIGDTVSLAGNQCTVELEEQEFRGRTELRVARFGSNKPPSKDELAELTKGLREAKGKAKPKKEKEQEQESPLHPPKPANGGAKPLGEMTQEEVKQEAAAVPPADEIPF